MVHMYGIYIEIVNKYVPVDVDRLLFRFVPNNVPVPIMFFFFFGHNTWLKSSTIFTFDQIIQFSQKWVMCNVTLS